VLHIAIPSSFTLSEGTHFETSMTSTKIKKCGCVFIYLQITMMKANSNYES